MESEITNKIGEQINEIKKISSEDRYFNLNWHVDVILGCLLDLRNLSQEVESKQRFELLWRNLDYTNSKEVSAAKKAFHDARKKNAPFKREQEYRSCLNKAIDQVLFELSYFNQ